MRAVLLVVGLGLSFGVPTATMLFHVQHEQLWKWDLYRHHGRNVCAVTWHRVGESNELIPVDRAELLEADGSIYALARKTRTIHADKLGSHSKRLCRRARKKWGKKTDLTITGACGGPGAWIDLRDFEGSVCTPGGQRRLAKVIRRGRKQIREENRRRRGEQPGKGAQE